MILIRIWCIVCKQDTAHRRQGTEDTVAAEVECMEHVHGKAPADWPQMAIEAARRDHSTAW